VRLHLCKQVVARERQIADPLSLCRENRIAKRGNERRHSGLSHAGRRRRALRNVDAGLSRGLVDPGYGKVIEIGLLDCAVHGGNLAVAHNARAEDRGTGAAKRHAAAKLCSRQSQYVPHVPRQGHVGIASERALLSIHFELQGLQHQVPLPQSQTSILRATLYRCHEGIQGERFIA
jgi:hypothetical protein